MRARSAMERLLAYQGPVVHVDHTHRVARYAPVATGKTIDGAVPTTETTPGPTLASERNELRVRVQNEKTYLKAVGRTNSKLLEVFEGRQQELFDPGYKPRNDETRLEYLEQFDKDRFAQTGELYLDYLDAKRSWQQKKDTSLIEVYERLRKYLYVLYYVYGQGVLPVPENL